MACLKEGGTPKVAQIGLYFGRWSYLGLLGAVHLPQVASRRAIQQSTRAVRDRVVMNTLSVHVSVWPVLNVGRACTMAYPAGTGTERVRCVTCPSRQRRGMYVGPLPTSRHSSKQNVNVTEVRRKIFFQNLAWEFGLSAIHSLRNFTNHSPWPRPNTGTSKNCIKLSKGFIKCPVSIITVSLQIK